MTRWLLLPVLLLIYHFLKLLPRRSWTWLERTSPPTPPTPPLDQWFEVTFDDNAIHIEVKPPGTPTRQTFRWHEIERICYKVEDMGVSDGIYVFLRQQPESFAIPIEAKGGYDFWQEILRRGLFDAKLAIEVATSIEGIYCRKQN